MKFTVLTSLAILLSAGYAFAADTNAGTAGRPGAVLTADECVAAWHGSAGNELARFKIGELVPVTARGIVTNFEQADTDRDGKVSRAEFLEACKLGFVNASPRSPLVAGW
jgi:hypothetical protein